MLSSEIDSLGVVPENDSKEWKKKKAMWEECRDRQLSAREEVSRCKEFAQREKSAVEAEATMTQQKRERLQIREAKLNDQRDRLQSATVQGLDEKERREAEQVAKATDRQHMDERSREEIAALCRSIQETQYHSQQSWQQAQLIENAFQPHPLMGAASQARAITPEGDLPGTNPHVSAPTASGFRFPAFPTSDHSTSLHGTLPSLRYETRPRSVSMLSGNSVYTDFSDQDPAPPMPSNRTMYAIRGRQTSGSSGNSGSASGSVSSQRDQNSPAMGIAPKKSPVGKTSSPIWN